MAEMFTYTTLTASGVLPSNRYGTLEAIRERFGNTVDILWNLSRDLSVLRCLVARGNHGRVTMWTAPKSIAESGESRSV